MNQKGEITLFSCFILLSMMFIVLLCTFELQKSFRLMERRTQLFICVKEIKGEHHNFLRFMGQSNWGIKNINRLSLVIMFIPGLQGAAINTQKAKKYLQYIQEVRVIGYLKILNKLKEKNCPIDPRMFITPFKLGTRLLNRDAEGAAQLKQEQWTYLYFLKPYLLSLKINAQNFEGIKPQIIYFTEEKMATLSSHLSSL